MGKSGKLWLVDGSSYLYRAFFALPPLTTSAGVPTGAVLGVLNMLNKLLKDENPELIVVVLDAPGRTFRDELFEEYKAHRPPMPDDLRSQIEPLLAIIKAQGLPLLRVPGVEADDVIGTLAVRAAADGKQVLISTGDKDMAQLVNESITLINTMNNSVLDRAGVKAKFDVFPEQIVDYLALVGDSSDNIPGIEKVGPKTAAKFLNQYSTLDGLIAHVNDVSGKVGENLRAGLATLELSRKLATIRTDCELPGTLEELTPAAPDVAALRELYTRYELRSLLRQLESSSPGVSDEPPSLFNAGIMASGDSAGSSRGGAGGTSGSAGVGKGSHVPTSAIGDAESAHANVSLSSGTDGTAPANGGAATEGSPATGAGASPATTAERRYETVTDWAQLERWIAALRSRARRLAPRPSPGLAAPRWSMLRARARGPPGHR